MHLKPQAHVEVPTLETLEFAFTPKGQNEISLMMFPISQTQSPIPYVLPCLLHLNIPLGLLPSQACEFPVLFTANKSITHIHEEVPMLEQFKISLTLEQETTS